MQAPVQQLTSLQQIQYFLDAHSAFQVSGLEVNKVKSQ